MSDLVEWDDEEGEGTAAGDDGWGDSVEDEAVSAAAPAVGLPADAAIATTDAFAVLSAERLVERQMAIARRVGDLLYLSEDEAVCLLRYYGWSEQRAEREWFADQARVRREVGLSGATADAAAGDEGAAAAATVQCSTAYCDEVPRAEATRLGCGHWFCNDCWSGFLTSQINQGRSCLVTRCPGMRCTLEHTHGFGCACNERVPDSLFHRLVPDAALVAKFRRWAADAFVEGMRGSIRWCPRPGCDLAMARLDALHGGYSVTCGCGHLWCFRCNQEAHSPAPCDLVRRWLAREKSDDATEIWLAARTKECPKVRALRPPLPHTPILSLSLSLPPPPTVGCWRVSCHSVWCVSRRTRPATT